MLLLVENGREVAEVESGQSVELVTETTPFYGEAGGQVGDSGKITGPDFEIKVIDTIKDPTGITIHKGTMVSGRIKTGECNPDGRQGHEAPPTAITRPPIYFILPCEGSG